MAASIVTPEFSAVKASIICLVVCSMGLHERKVTVALPPVAEVPGLVVGSGLLAPPAQPATASAAAVAPANRAVFRVSIVLALLTSLWAHEDFVNASTLGALAKNF
jgi:hypothetical protein